MIGLLQVVLTSWGHIFACFLGTHISGTLFCCLFQTAHCYLDLYLSYPHQLVLNRQDVSVWPVSPLDAKFVLVSHSNICVCVCPNPLTNNKVYLLATCLERLVSPNWRPVLFDTQRLLKVSKGKCPNISATFIIFIYE